MDRRGGKDKQREQRPDSDRARHQDRFAQLRSEPIQFAGHKPADQQSVPRYGDEPEPEHSKQYAEPEHGVWRQPEFRERVLVRHRNSRRKPNLYRPNTERQHDFERSQRTRSVARLHRQCFSGEKGQSLAQRRQAERENRRILE